MRRKVAGLSLSHVAVNAIIHLFEQRSSAKQWPPDTYYREDHMACLACDQVSLLSYMSGCTVGMTNGASGSHAAVVTVATTYRDNLYAPPAPMCS